MKESRRAAAAAVLLALLKAGCYLVLFLGSQLLVSVGAVAVITLLHPESAAAELEALLTAQTPLITVISGALTLVFLVIFFAVRKISPLKAAGLVAVEDRLVGSAAAITPALYLVVSMLLAMVPEHWMEGYEQASAALGGSDVLTLLATVIFAPLAEEIIFRGLVQSRLERVMPGWAACLLSALLFGLCHGQLLWIAYAFLMGFLFGRMRQAGGSLLPSLAAHFIFNLIGYLMGALEPTVGAETLSLSLMAFAIAGAVVVRGQLPRLFGIGKPKVS